MVFPLLLNWMVPVPASPFPLFVMFPATVTVFPELIVREAPELMVMVAQVNAPGATEEAITTSVVTSGVPPLQVDPFQVEVANKDLIRLSELLTGLTAPEKALACEDASIAGISAV